MQAVAEELPVAPSYVPAEQLVQLVMELLPVTSTNRPAGQLSGDELLARQYEPAGQSSGRAHIEEQ